MTRRPPVDPKHPVAERWWARATGALGRAEARRLDEHRVACTACAKRAAGAERLARARGLFDLEAPPVAARRRARKLFIETRTAGPPLARSASSRVPALRLPSFGRLRVVHAFGAGGGATLAGATRRAGAETLRRCALEGGTWRLEIEWTPLDRAWAIRGRIVDLGVPARRGSAPAVRIESAGGPERAVRVGPRGFFGPVRVAAPELRVRLEDASRSFRSPWLPKAPRSRR